MVFMNYKRAKLTKLVLTQMIHGIRQGINRYLDQKESLMVQLAGGQFFNLSWIITAQFEEVLDAWIKKFSGTPILVETDLVKELRKHSNAIEQYPLALSMAYLLHGEPGVGKSYAALGLEFKQVSPFDILVGSSTNKEDSESSAPLLTGSSTNIQKLIIDEVDKLIDSDPKFERSLLAYLDKKRNEKAIIVMTTNFPDKLPAALFRPGRVSRIVEVQPWTRDTAIEFCRLYDVPIDEAPRRETGYYVGDLIEWTRERKLKEMLDKIDVDKV